MMACAVKHCKFKTSDRSKMYNHSTDEHSKKNGKDLTVKCGFCGQQFPTKTDYTRHTLLKHPPKVYKCPICRDYVTESRDAFIHHMRHHHRNVGLTLPQRNALADGGGSEALAICDKCKKKFGTVEVLAKHIFEKHTRRVN
jgi:hypothetical protein